MSRVWAYVRSQTPIRNSAERLISTPGWFGGVEPRLGFRGAAVPASARPVPVSVAVGECSGPGVGGGCRDRGVS